MSIQSELEKIRAYTVSPSNEAETCHWVIVPLLEACGYARHEINSQNPDGAGKYPDFTILTGTQYQWFLEAKSWNVTLADSHINQAIFSAYSTGRRWVVLSNGQEWRLYDATVHAPTPGDRLVAKAKISDGGDFEGFLHAISKESVTSGRILQFAAQSRVTEIIEEQLKSKDSLLIRRITEVLRKELKAPDASPETVLSALTGIKSQIAPGNGGPRPGPPPPPVPGEQIFVLTPLRDEKDDKVSDIFDRLLKKGWFVLGEGASCRKQMKPGDKIAFYYTGVGVVAEAVVASHLERVPHPEAKNPERYPWRFQASNVRIFLDKPIPLNSVEFRSRLDAFKGRPPENSWSWFVQGTGRVTEHDFNLLVGKS